MRCSPSGHRFVLLQMQPQVEQTQNSSQPQRSLPLQVIPPLHTPPWHVSSPHR